MQTTFYEYALVKTAEMTEAERNMCVRRDTAYLKYPNAGNYNPAEARKGGTYSHQMHQMAREDYFDNCMDTARGAIPLTYGHGYAGDHLFANDRLKREAGRACKARLAKAVKNPDAAMDGQNPFNMDVQNRVDISRRDLAGERRACGLPPSAAPYTGRAWKGPVNHDWKEGMMRRNGVPMVKYDEETGDSYFADRITEDKVNPFNVGRTSARRTPAGRTPVGRTPVGRTPVGRTPVGRTPVGRTPRKK